MGLLLELPDIAGAAVAFAEAEALAVTAAAEKADCKPMQSIPRDTMRTDADLTPEFNMGYFIANFL